MVVEKEEKYIEELRNIICELGSDSEAFHGCYDGLLEEIIRKELGFKKFFDVLDEEYKGYFWCA